MTALARASLACVALAAATDASADLAPACSARGAAQRLPAATLDVRLATTVALSLSARHSLVREVEGIWCREGVRVRWSAAGGLASPAGYGLRVLVVRGDVGSDARKGHTWPVGELRGDSATNPVALASLAAAQRVVASANHSGDPTSLADRRLGVVLGRAVAHEIGHHLLGAGHARHGLMRAHIAATDFADLRTGGFHLDGDGAAHVREALARRPHDAERPTSPDN